MDDDVDADVGVDGDGDADMLASEGFDGDELGDAPIAGQCANVPGPPPRPPPPHPRPPPPDADVDVDEPSASKSNSPEPDKTAEADAAPASDKNPSDKLVEKRDPVESASKENQNNKQGADQQQQRTLEGWSLFAALLYWEKID